MKFGLVLVVVERAAANPVFRAVFLQLDAPALRQGQQVGLALDALNVGFGNAPGHKR